MNNPALHPAHPSPLRGHVGRFALWFALLGAPLAWSLDELAAYLIASNSCGPKGYSQASLLMRGSSAAYLALTALTWLIAVAAVWVALANWRKTKDEHPGGGSHLMELGEGRTRFMSMWGLMTSASFAVAFAYLAVQNLAAPLCDP
jgi:hypothetical protein